MIERGDIDVGVFKVIAVDVDGLIGALVMS